MTQASERLGDSAVVRLIWAQGMCYRDCSPMSKAEARAFIGKPGYFWDYVRDALMWRGDESQLSQVQ